MLLHVIPPLFSHVWETCLTHYCSTQIYFFINIHKFDQSKIVKLPTVATGMNAAVRATVRVGIYTGAKVFFVHEVNNIFRFFSV